MSFKGKRHTPEAIEKIRKGNLGKTRSPEAIEKDRAAKIGRKMVSRNDAAFIEIAKQYFEYLARQNASFDDDASFADVLDVMFGDDDTADDLDHIIDQLERLEDIANAYLRGEDIILEKLKQQ